MNALGKLSIGESVTGSSARSCWLNLLNRILANGQHSAPRGKRIKELLAMTTSFPMKYPVVNDLRRKLSYRFLAGEAWWILAGRNDVESIAKYNSVIRNFSDDDKTFFGAYGPKIEKQIGALVLKLAEDPDSRQAYLNIWREDIRPTKDVPCTVGVQFLIRDGYLICIDHMRSSDAWLGWPYDAFNFSMLAGYVALQYKALTRKELVLGDLIMHLGSSHLYQDNWEAAGKCWAENVEEFKYRGFDHRDFSSGLHLVNHLQLLADRNFESCETPFLLELGGIRRGKQ